MGTWINKEAYEKMIAEDIERLEKDMKQCPERDHIKAILSWSTNQIYKGVVAINTSGSSVLPIQRVSNSKAELSCATCKHYKPDNNPKCSECFARDKHKLAT